MNIVAITGMDLSYLQNHIPEDLQDQVNFLWFTDTASAQEHLGTADVLITTGRMNPQIMEKTPQLKWVQTLSAGVDKLPLQAFAERDIVLTNARGVHTVQMSEYTLSLMLQWVRKVNVLSSNQQQGVWDMNIPFDELYGKTVGIVGAGAIGEAIARKARAFDMRVIGLNRSGAPNEQFDEMLSGDAGLDELLSRSDFVVLLVPSTSKTKRLITEERLSLMKPSGFLINIARGDVIDEAALIAALQTGRLAGAALDVFEQEPLPADSPLWGLDNVILTPHIAGVSAHYTQRASEILYHNIRAFLSGQPLMNVVNIREGY